MRGVMRSHRAGALPALALVLVAAWSPTSARAAIPGMAESPVHWEHEADVCGIGMEWETGWVPSGSPVQVEMHFHLGCEFGAELDGKGVMVWPPSMSLYFQGEPRGGDFWQNVGIDFGANIRWDIDVPLIGHSTGEMPIPYVPRIDIGCLERDEPSSHAKFTPFLLSGNPDTPATLTCTVGPILVFEYDVLDLVLPEISAFASVLIQIWLTVDLHSYLQGDKIVVSEHEQEITEEYGRATVYPRGAPAMDMTAQYFADLSNQIIVTLSPRVEFEVLTFDFGFDIVNVNIPIPSLDDHWVFDPAELSFYFPDISNAPELDFGRTQVGRPRLKRFAVENVGFDDLKLYARSALPFGVDARLGDPTEEPLTIPAPGMDDLIVSFDPGGEGNATGILRLETNDPDEPWVDVRLKGEATLEDVGEYTDPDDCEGDECFDQSSGYATTCGCRVPGDGGGTVWPLAGLIGIGWGIARRRRRS
ncbi:MAG: hypothetical protein HY905_09775 [Deltaproteobacteria bacterium]|nr:hypothetical protein [Deltaproteobacteria bacterium]